MLDKGRPMVCRLLLELFVVGYRQHYDAPPVAIDKPRRQRSDRREF
jgi:hypothetical protein